MNPPKYFKPMATVTLAMSLLITSPPLSAEDDGVLHQGTPVRLKLNRTISSASEQQGDQVDFEVLDNVVVDGVTVVPQGAIALATVTEAVPKGRMAKGGKLNVNIDYVRLPNGGRLPLRGVQGGKGGGHTGAMTGAMVGTAIVFWPAAPLFLFIHGKDITIPKGHEVTVYTDSDYTLKPAVAEGPANKANHASTPALCNADVLALKQAGFSDELLIAKIKSAPGDFHLNPDDLINLKRAGVSDSVIVAMMNGSR